MAKINAEQKEGIFRSMLETFLTVYITSAMGLSQNTKDSYTVTFRLLILYVREKLNLAPRRITFALLDKELIEGFLDWLETDRNNSVATRNSRLAALKSFAKYAEPHNFEASARFSNMIRKVPAKRGKGSKRAYFTIPEAKILISLPKLNTISGRRDSVLLPLMLTTGARGQEICDLKVSDVLFVEEGRAKITLHGKGNKSRRVIVSAEIARILTKYMRSRRILGIPEAYVFCTQNHPQMSVSCIEEIYKKYVSIAKKENPSLFKEKAYTPHSMRHTTAMCMLSSGVPLSVIQVFLGHINITTTQIYAEYTQPALDEEIIKWNNSFWAHVKDESVSIEDAENPAEDDEAMPAFLC